MNPDEMLYLITTKTHGEIYLKTWQSGNPAASKNCDACIGYAYYDGQTLQEIDGGEMDYNSEEKDYKSVCDAFSDILDFIFDDDEILSYAESDKNPGDFE